MSTELHALDRFKSKEFVISNFHNLTSNRNNVFIYCNNFQPYKVEILLMSMPEVLMPTFQDSACH